MAVTIMILCTVLRLRLQVSVRVFVCLYGAGDERGRDGWTGSSRWGQRKGERRKGLKDKISDHFYLCGNLGRCCMSDRSEVASGGCESGDCGG